MPPPVLASLKCEAVAPQQAGSNRRSTTIKRFGKAEVPADCFPNPLGFALGGASRKRTPKQPRLLAAEYKALDKAPPFHGKPRSSYHRAAPEPPVVQTSFASS